MSNRVLNNVPFGVTGGKTGVISLTYLISTGTVTLQKLCGNDETVELAWIDVTDGEFSATGECTFWAPPGQKYRCQITGTAGVYYAG